MAGTDWGFKLNVLFVNRMAGLVRGGGETFDLDISRALEKLGCEVHFLTGAPLLARAPLPIGRPRVHYLSTPYLPWFPWDKLKGGWRVRTWEFRQFEKKAAKWIMAHAGNVDIIQVCELPFLVSMIKSAPTANRSLPVVLRLTAPNVHDVWNGVALADSVIASGTSIEKIRKTIRADVVDIPNGVDLERFKVAGSRFKVQGEEGGRFEAGEGENLQPSTFNLQPALLYVARFQAFKNHALLIRAFKLVASQLPELVLKLVGSGPLRGEIEKQVAEAGLKERVVFLGEVAHEDLPAVNQSATMAVISSEYESFCFAAIEAMACGLPVVTTDCGWVPKLLGDDLDPIQKQWAHGGDEPGRFVVENQGARIRKAPGGLIVSRQEPESLANAIVTMLRDNELREQCGKWNREKAVREHGWENSARKLLGLYESLSGSLSRS